MTTAFAVLRALYPEEERVRETRVTEERMPITEALDLVEQVRESIFDRGYAPVEGPKLFRERQIIDGVTTHVVTVVAIVRKLAWRTAVSDD